MEIVTAVAAKIAEVIIVPVGQWLCYACHYKSNMENLKNQEEKLQNAKKRVQHDVKDALNKGDNIEDDVKAWLTEVDGIIDQLATKKFGRGQEEAESRNSNVSWLNLKQRHQISREAEEMLDNIAELLKRADFPKVSYCPAAQEMVTPRTMDYITLDSRISITKRIMETLENAKINKIGVWGSPGVGKSTLMKEIFRKAKEESLFNEVAHANVTDSPNISRIQGEIADMLDLKLDPDCTTEMVRAGRLRKRLEKDKEKKILVILDDIWKRLDLEEIGITPSERCKVLFTSRDRHVLASMGTEENSSFELDILGQEEAWNLFEKMAGDSVKHDLDLRKAAIEVAKACAGLPIALVTVSRALKNKRLSVWKDALVQLTRPTREHETEIWLPVYSCIRLSYENLVGTELKSLFLLCARQGYYISSRDLLRYGFGLRLFLSMDTLDEARNRLENLVCKLQDFCLLQQSPRSSEEFYMHDHVRHVATKIALKHNMFVMRGDGGQKAWPDVDELERCEALSIHGGDHIDKYPNKIECPKLRYFHVQCNLKPMFKTPSSTSFQGMAWKDRLEDIFFQGMERLEDIFFPGMEKLAVLSLTNIQLSASLPLTNLQTLCLDGCKLGDIHWIGELKTLEILSLARSDISNLPGEIRSLTRLRLLDLTNCSKLRVIPPNVLSSLVKLEELYLRCIDVQWEVEGPNNEGKNASLAELKKLSHLITLEIKIPDANNLPKDLFSEKLERYKICIGNMWDLNYLMSFKEEAALSRTLKLKLNMSSFQLDFGIKMLLKRTEYLYLDESNSTKSVFYELDREDFQKLKHLHIQNGNIKHIPELRTSAAFPILETFVLKHMISLEEICQGNLPLKSFENLKVLEVENCEKLRFIFSSSIARGLSLLEELKITRCNNVGAIFVKEEEDHGREEVFRRLQTLVLRDLPKLVSFLSPRETNSEGNHDLQLPLLHHQLSFPSLKNLHLQHLPKIKHVWSNVNGCESLKSLEIQDCGVMEDIVAREDGIDPTTRLLFPSLTLLRLARLPKLKWFFQGVRTLESSSSKELHEQGGTLFGIEEVSFPSLQTLRMKGLSKIKHVWSCGQEPKTVFRCLEQLKILEIKDCGVEEIVAGGGGGGELVARTILEFPRVTDLTLENLKRLKWFYKGVHVTKWPMLEKIFIERCEKVEIFASGVVSFEETVEERQSEMSIKQPLYLVDELSFSSLKTLHIRNMDKLEIICQDQVAASSFSKNIQHMNIWICGKLLHVFQSYVLMQSLTRLWIQDCSSLETIFRNMEGHNGKEPQVLIAPSSGMEESVAREDGIARHIEFPILTEMILDGLPKLKWILEGVHTNLECPSLEILELWECEQVIWASKFASSSSSQEKSQQNKLRTCIQLPLPNLLELELGICHVKLPSTSFKKLRVLKLENCEKLRFIFPSSIARGLSLLEVLEIRRCNNMGVIVVKEEKDRIEDGDVILFHQLQTLVLENLPELVSFLSTRSSFMTDSRQIITEGNRDLHMPLLHHQVAFSNLTKLHLRNLPKIKHVWSKDPQTILRFQNLQEIFVGGCASLKSLFTVSVGTCLKKLKEIRINDCGVLEEIVGAEGGEAMGKTLVFEFPQVTSLDLENLPRLECFYKRVHLSKWPILKTMSIKGCDKVEVFASRLMSFEETVEERQYSQMSIKQPLFLVDELSFSSLKKLVIENMDKLEIIWQDQVATSSFAKNIQDVEIHGCEKLLHVFQSNFRTTTILTQSLIRLCIWDCSSLETIFRYMEGHNGKEPQVLIAPSSGMEESGAREDRTARHIKFPILTEMSLGGLPKLKWILEGVHTNLECPSLEILELWECEQVIWASKFASSSSSQETSQLNQLQTRIQLPPPNLLELQVLISGREEIFPYEVVDPVPRLRRLELYHLPLLTHLWKEDSTQPCPLFHNLEFLCLSQCGKLKNIVPFSVFLQNLTELDISHCHGLINLLTSSTAKTLVQLQKMTVKGCKRIIEIVAMEDGEANVAITFNKLAYLQLEDLPNLTHFCSGPYSIGFPSLNKLIVRRCPDMKTFCDGLLSTPELEFEFALEA